MANEWVVSFAERAFELKNEYEISTGLMAKIESHHVFIVQNRDRWKMVASNIWESGLVGVGGKLEKGETIIECVRRECLEELDCDVELEDSNITYLVTQHSIIEANLPANDVNPRPLVIMLMERTEPGRKPYTPVFSYRGNLLRRPRPVDVSALFLGNDSVLTYLTSGPKTVEFLRQHSAQFIERISLPENLYLRPYGTVLAYLKLLQSLRRG